MPACSSPDGFALFGREPLVAPPLLWSECRSALHEALFRREVSRADAVRALAELGRAPIRSRTHRRLGRRALELADQFGWAKAYDAEYLALADLLGARLITLDARLRRATTRLGYVLTPSE